MALDATPAGTTADSYLTVAVADDWASGDYGPEVDAWLAADPEDKERCLKRATRDIDVHVASDWPPFDRASQRVSGLVFPRSVDKDPSSGEPEVPLDIRRATYHQALFVLVNAPAIAAANARIARNKNQASEPNHAYTQGDPADPNVLISILALPLLAPFKRAPRSRSAGSLGSVRVSSGFMGSR